MGLRGPSNPVNDFMGFNRGKPDSRGMQNILAERNKRVYQIKPGRGGRRSMPRAGEGSRELIKGTAEAAKFLLVPSLITEGPAESFFGKGLQAMEMLPFVPKGLGKVGKHLVKGGMDPQTAAIAEEGMKILSGRKQGLAQRAEKTRRKIATMEIRAKHGHSLVPTDVAIRRNMALSEGAKAAESAKSRLQIFPENPVSTANRNKIKIADDARRRMGMSTPSPFSGQRSPLHRAGRQAGESREYKDMMTESYYEGKVDFNEGFEASPIRSGSVRPKSSKRTPAKGKSAKKRYTERRNRKSNYRMLKQQGKLPKGYTPGMDRFLP